MKINIEEYAFLKQILKEYVVLFSKNINHEEDVSIAKNILQKISGGK